MSNTKIIIALDFSSELQVFKFLNEFSNEKLFLKVGMELYYSCGNSLISKLKEAGHDVFLDMKLHDIPNTVGQAMKAIAKLDVNIVNVHASGGKAMMEAAIAGLEEGTECNQQRPLCIAVTQLTSTSQKMMNDELKISGEVSDVVVDYARLAKDAGLDGVVSSPLEVPLIKDACGSSFVTVTPGIRLLGDDANDQKRITTPKEAAELGSDFIVVGRSITKAVDPLCAYEKIKQEMD